MMAIDTNVADRTKTGGRKHRLIGAVLIGVALALIDAAAFGDPLTWAQDPPSSMRALVYLMAAYTVPCVTAALILRWRPLAFFSVGGFAMCQVLAFVLRTYPQAGAGGFAVALGAAHRLHPRRLRRRKRG